MDKLRSYYYQYSQVVDPEFSEFKTDYKQLLPIYAGSAVMASWANQIYNVNNNNHNDFLV